MSEPKFTPGPWYAAQPEECGGWWVVAKDPDGRDCIDSGDGGFEKEDAHLIAAAPDLYKALERIDAFIDDEFMDAAVFSEIIYNALIKARGEQ